METCPSLWHLRGRALHMGALGGLSALLLWPMLFGVTAAAIATTWGEGTSTVLIVAGGVLPLLALLSIFSVAALAQLAVAWCAFRGRLHGIQWARDGTQFLYTYSRVTAAISLLVLLPLAFELGPVAFVPGAILGIYAAGQRRVTRWLDGLPRTHRDWWAWYEATLPGPPGLPTGWGR